MFGKSATAITDYLTSDESFDPEHCVSLLQRSLKKKAEKVLESIEGYSISDEQKARIKIIREHYDFIEKLIAKVDTCVNEMVENTKVKSIFFAPFRVLTETPQSPLFLKSARI